MKDFFFRFGDLIAEHMPKKEKKLLPYNKIKQSIKQNVWFGEVQKKFFFYFVVNYIDFIFE